MARRTRRSAEDLRSAVLAVRLTEDESDRIKRRAARAGKSPSGYLAALARGDGTAANDPAGDGFNADRYARLTRIGHLLGQLEDATRAGRIPRDDALSIVAIKELLTGLIRDEIAGSPLMADQGEPDGSEDARARDEFQRRVGLSPAR